MTNGFYLVYQGKQLNKIINFLEKGFGWSTQRSLDLYRLLKNQNKKNPCAAYELKDGKIVSAILLFHQGWHEREEKEIINLSSWYALPVFRGILAFKFAKNLTTALEGYVITNYTPSEAVYAMFKALNYSDMNVNKITLKLSKRVPFINLKSIKQIVKIGGLNMAPLSKASSDLGLYCSDYQFCFYTINKMKIFSLNVNVINVYVPKKGDKIDALHLFYLVLKHRSVRVDVIVKSDQSIHTGVWLIKNCTETGRFIFPYNSELEVAFP